MTDRPPLKVAVVGAHPPSLSSLTEYGAHLVAALRRQADVCEVVALSDELPEGSYDGGAEAAWRLDDVRNPLRILGAIRRHRPDVVLFNLQNATFGRRTLPAALGLLTPAILRWAGFPTVVLLHNLADMIDAESVGFGGGRLWRLAYRLGSRVVTRALLASDQVVVTVSRYVDFLASEYGATNVAHVPHGSFGQVEYRPPPGDAPRLLAFGKFGTYKRLDILFTALESLWDRGFEVELVVAGSDNPNSPGYLAEMERLHGHRDEVTFLGYAPEAEVPELFLSSWAVVMPYTVTTGSSGVLHQAGDFGRAVIMPAIGDFVDLVSEEGYAAETFDVGDPDSLAEAIERVMCDVALRERLGRANLAASRGWSMDDVATAHVEAFRRLL